MQDHNMIIIMKFLKSVALVHAEFVAVMIVF